MFPRFQGRPGRLAGIAALSLALLPAAAGAQAIVKVNDTINFRLGLIAQPTYEASQDPNSEDYSQNWYLRRIRFIVGGTLAKNVTFFYQTDNPRVGNAGNNGDKNVNTGFLTQDAWVQWGFAGEKAQLIAGLFFVPTVRQPLTSVATFLSLDLPTWTLQQNTALKGNGARDYGIGINGYLAGDHLSYRTGLFSGNRETPTPQPAPLGNAAGSRNAPRIAARVQYDFFDTEKGYTYQGTYLGKKKVFAVGAVAEGQQDYRGYAGDVFFDWPVGKDAVTLEGDYMHFDGHDRFTAIPKQDTFFANAGYYFDAIKLQPFFRYETLNFDAEANNAREQHRVGGGLNYYVAGQNFKITGYYERIVPKVQPVTAAIKSTNRFVVQFQAFYY